MKRAFCVLTGVMCEKNQVLTNMKLIKNFKDWKFRDPPNYAELPIDDNPEYNVPVAVKNAVFSKVPTEPLTGDLHLVCASEDGLNLLDLDSSVAESEEFIDFVAGKYLPSGGLSVSHRYGGYQFGFWADQLGDGRAHTLGEYVNSKGESWQPQLKGSGETPYSRFGDGRAVLRSSIREMLGSEACHHLGVPTTRAAALVVSDTHKVWRDKNYSGSARPERAAVVVRLAPAWYRIGSLEILDKKHEINTLKTLVDFIIKHHFPNIESGKSEDKYVELFSEVAHRNLDMVATWQVLDSPFIKEGFITPRRIGAENVNAKYAKTGVGFTHGVLNTDNVSLLGLTIDYGPYGFIDHYSQHYVPNTSDDMGRYAFNKQPGIILWNLEKMALAMAPILSEEEKKRIEDIRSTLEEYVMKKVTLTYVQKLGLKEIQNGDEKLVDTLLGLLQDSMADFTATFRQLSEVDINNLADNSILETKWALNKVKEASQWEQWVTAYKQRLELENVSEEERRKRMSQVNPIYVPRNWILQDAIADAEKNDFEKVRFLIELFKRPFEVNEEAEKRGYSAQPPSWSYGLKLSCSS